MRYAAAVKIITGSIQGVLRVHQPHQQGYHIEDILLEVQLDSSILQLAAGNFLGCVQQPCCLQLPVPDHSDTLQRLAVMWRVMWYSGPPHDPSFACVLQQIGRHTGHADRMTVLHLTSVLALVLPAEGPVYA